MKTRKGNEDSSRARYRLDCFVNTDYESIQEILVLLARLP